MTTYQFAHIASYYLRLNAAQFPKMENPSISYLSQHYAAIIGNGPRHVMLKAKKK